MTSAAIFWAFVGLSAMFRTLDLSRFAAVEARVRGFGHGEDHLHAHRRGAAAGDVLLPADHRGVRRQGGRRRGDPRHLAGGPDHLAVPGAADRRAADRRRPRRARRAGHQARGQHHQAAQRLGVGAAAQDRHRRAAVAGLRPARLPREPGHRRGARRSAPATTRSRARRSTRSCARATPTVARPRRSRTTRKKHPHRMGAWVPDSKTNVATMGQHDFFSNEASVVLDGRRHAADRARRRRRHRHRAQGVAARARRRGRRRHLHGRRRAAPLPHRADRPRQGRRRAVLGAPQGHDDEGLGPDPVRARGAGVLPDAVRAVRRRARRRPRSRPTTASAPCSPRPPRCPRATRSPPPSPRASPTARRWRWSTPTRASPTCTSPPT